MKKIASGGIVVCIVDTLYRYVRKAGKRLAHGLYLVYTSNLENNIGSTLATIGNDCFLQSRKAQTRPNKQLAVHIPCKAFALKCEDSIPRTRK